MGLDWRRLWFNLVYFRRPPWDTRVSPPELIQFLDSRGPGSALDIGCGTGTNLLTMASYGWQVTGIEYAWRAAMIARNRLSKAGVRAKVWMGDVTRMGQIQDRYHLVLDMGCYHGIPADRRGAYRANLFRWLAPGGTYLLYAHILTEGRPVGITEMDIQSFSTELRLLDRQDSFDSGDRKAVWMKFEHNK